MTETIELPKTVRTFTFIDGYNNKTGRDLFCLWDIVALDGKDVLPIKRFDDVVGAIVVSIEPTDDPVFAMYEDVYDAVFDIDPLSSVAETTVGVVTGRIRVESARVYQDDLDGGIVRWNIRINERNPDSGCRGDRCGEVFGR